METQDAIRSVVENIPGICQLMPEQEECLVHILNGGDAAKVVHSHLHSGISLDGFVFAAYLCLQRKFEAAEPAHNICHNQTLCDWLTGTPMILNFRKAPPPRESKRLSIMPFQTLSMKQSEVAEFGITRLIYIYIYCIYRGERKRKCFCQYLHVC